MKHTKKPYGLPASYRIKRKKIFDTLFSQGNSIYEYPFKIIYAETELPEPVPYQVAFGVSKKKFKKAVRRNRIKRLMRETFRLKQEFLKPGKPIALLIIYTSSKEESFDFLLMQMEKILSHLTEKLQNHGPA